MSAKKNASCQVLGVDPTQDSHLITSNSDVIVIITVFLSIIAAFTVFANAVVIIALVRPRNQPWTITTYMVTSMAVSDVLMGGYVMPLGIYVFANNGKWHLGSTICDIWLNADIILCTVSIYHVINMAIERYLAVAKPFVYRRLSVKTPYIMILFSWLVPTSMVVLPVYLKLNTIGIEDVAMCLGEDKTLCALLVNTHFTVYMSVISFFGPIIIITIIYALIFKKIKEAAKFQTANNTREVRTEGAERSRVNNINNSESNGNISIVSVQMPERQPKSLRKFKIATENIVSTPNTHNRRNSNFKTAKAIGRLVVCFMVCWIPFSVWFFITPFIGVSTPVIVHLALTWLAYINSAVNPIIYCSNESVKTAVRSLLFPKQKAERRRNKYMRD